MWPSASVRNVIRSYGFDGPRRVLLGVRRAIARLQGFLRRMSPRPTMAAERRPQILAAAARVIARRGIDRRYGSRTSPTEAGVSVGTIQHYFGTRERLLLETFAFETERAVERWRLGRARRHERLGSRCSALVEIVLDPPTFRERWTRWLQFWAAYARDPTLTARDGRGLRAAGAIRSGARSRRGRRRRRSTRVLAGGRDRRPDASRSSTGSRCRSSSRHRE